MEKEMYFVNENGQLEMNFDALECVTNIFFAQFIRGIMPERVLKKVSITQNEMQIFVTSQNGRVLSVHRFDRYFKTYESTHYNKYDLQEMLSYLGGEIV